MNMQYFQEFISCKYSMFRWTCYIYKRLKVFQCEPKFSHFHGSLIQENKRKKWVSSMFFKLMIFEMDMVIT